MTIIVPHILSSISAIKLTLQFYRKPENEMETTGYERCHTKNTENLDQPLEEIKMERLRSCKTNMKCKCWRRKIPLNSTQHHYCKE
jgi:hypothetical protein